MVAFVCLVLATTCHAADSYNNPIIADGADPWVIQKDGFYYYTHTTGGDVRIRKASRVTGSNGLANAAAITVFTPLAPNNKGVWAPELHFLNGKWYIYFAADDGDNANHRMYVAESLTSDPQGVYISKGKIYDATDDRWAIDGTVLQMDDGKLYFVWSGWPGAVDGQQNLYIAPMSNPWTISGPRVLISTPTHGWEWWINEGPQIIKRNGKIFIVYSANGSWTDQYCLGLLTYTNGNILDRASWTKRTTPVFKKYSDLNGAVYGPGHCSFGKSVDSTEDLIFYHAAKFSGAGWNRDVRVQRFTWNADDSPRFDVPVPPNVPLTVPSGEGTPRTPVTTYTLTVNAGPGAVRAQPQQLRYKPGSVVSLSAFNYAGMRFTGWSSDVWTTNSIVAVTMDRDKTATANYSRPLVIIDNPDAAYTGTWTVSTNSTERFGGDYHYAWSSNVVTHSATFRPNIAVDGRYDVYTIHSSGSNRSAAAPWRISSQDGVSTVYVNQKTNGGVWYALSTDKKFTAGTNGFVQLSNNTAENSKAVIADAVAFLYSTSQDLAPFIYSQPLSQTVPLGDSVTLSVGVPGSPAYQWWFDDYPLPGAIAPTLTITNFNAQNEGQYRVVATNAFGAATSSVAVLRLDWPVRLARLNLTASRLQFQLIGPAGSNYILETSEDLRSWMPTDTNLVINGLWDITTDNTTNWANRFYRIAR